MAYSPDIPQATDDPSQSQPLLLGNFQEIAAAFNLNHGDFNTGEQGLHKFLQMPEQSSAPTTAANEGALYTKDSSGSTQLFWREESNGTEYQLTNPFVASANGYITFPGGLLMQWTSGLASSGATVSFPTPFTTAVYNIQVTANTGNSSAAMNVGSPTLTGATIYTSPSPQYYYLFAIGV